MVWVYKDNGVGAVVTSGILGVPARAADPLPPTVPWRAGARRSRRRRGRRRRRCQTWPGLNCSKLSPEASANGRQTARTMRAPSRARRAGAAPRAEWTVTQAEAKAWFEAAGADNIIGEGVYGETRQAQACDRWVAIKRFLDENHAKARTEAKTEVDNHLAVWRRSSDL